MITKKLLEKYARLIVRTGANVQPGQIVRLNVAVDQQDFALMVMEECYKAGAKKVNIEWSSDGQSRLNLLYAGEETLSRVLPWEEEKMKQMTEDLPVNIWIDSEDPDAYAGLDVKKLTAVNQKRSAVLKPYRDRIDGKYQWLIVAVPSVPWAKKCFPELSDEEAVEKLWDAILKTVRVDAENDPVAEWEAHSRQMTKKADWLNSRGFVKLHYESASGTDLTVGMIPGAKWCGAGTVNPVNNVFYIPNMPTEEVFTSPMAGQAEGIAVATKPLSWNGQLIENFSVTFKEGRAVSVKAEKGQELLEQMIVMDERSGLLGETALVPFDSPINKCGFLFNNTLFDENACCHLALGTGFKEVLEGGDDLSVEEALKQGVNDSLIHVDFMIGAADMKITGIREDGTAELIFVNGTWA